MSRDKKNVGLVILSLPFFIAEVKPQDEFKFTERDRIMWPVYFKTLQFPSSEDKKCPDIFQRPQL